MDTKQIFVHTRTSSEALHIPRVPRPRPCPVLGAPHAQDIPTYYNIMNS